MPPCSKRGFDSKIQLLHFFAEHCFREKCGMQIAVLSRSFKDPLHRSQDHLSGNFGSLKPSILDVDSHYLWGLWGLSLRVGSGERGRWGQPTRGSQTTSRTCCGILVSMGCTPLGLAFRGRALEAYRRIWRDPDREDRAAGNYSDRSDIARLYT